MSNKKNDKKPAAKAKPAVEVETAAEVETETNEQEPLNEAREEKLNEAGYLIFHEGQIQEKVAAGLTEEQAKQVVAAQGRNDGDL